MKLQEALKNVKEYTYEEAIAEYKRLKRNNQLINGAKAFISLSRYGYPLVEALNAPQFSENHVYHVFDGSATTPEDVFISRGQFESAKNGMIEDIEIDLSRGFTEW